MSYLYGNSGDSSAILFVCSLEEKSPIFISHNVTTKTWHFEWLTQHACPVCITGQYTVATGSCIDGHRVIDYVPNKDMRCARPPQATETCTGDSAGITGWMFIGALATVCVGAGGIIFVMKRKHDITSNRYAQLLSNSGRSSGFDARLISEEEKVT